MILLGLQDGADHAFLQPNPSPGVIGAIFQVRINGKLYDCVPPPIDRVRVIARVFTQRTVGATFGGGGFGGWFPVRLDNREFTLWLTVVPDHHAEHISVQLPTLPELQTIAKREFATVLTEDGLMYNDDADFE
jgi:hypothetical protein